MEETHGGGPNSKWAKLTNRRENQIPSREAFRGEEEDMAPRGVGTGNTPLLGSKGHLVVLPYKHVGWHFTWHNILAKHQHKILLTEREHQRSSIVADGCRVRRG